MATKIKKQLKLYISEQLDETLRQDADRYGFSSPQEVVEEVLTMYLPFWRQVKEAQSTVHDQQAQALTEVLEKLAQPSSKSKKRK